jgi:DNA-binding NtrC family response regulator
MHPPEEPLQRHPDVVDFTVPYSEARRRLLDQFERTYVSGLLEIHDGNVSQAAASAQVDRVHLHRIIRRHRLKG